MLVQNKEKQTKEVEVVTSSYRLCDKCNEKIIKPAYDAFEFKFLYKTGNCFPEGGDGVTSEMDLCKKCSKKLVTFLEDSGYRISNEEWDY